MARTSNPRTTTPKPTAKSGQKMESSRQRGTATEPTAARSSEHTNGIPTREEIARRAYEIFQKRGGSGGADVDDWLQAERELRAERH